EPGDDELGDLLARREPREHGVDGDGPRRGGRGGPAPGTSGQQSDYKESMRAHYLFLLVCGLGCSAGASRNAAAQVRPGIEVVLSDSLRLIAGKRLGLLTNHSGVDREGRRDVDLLRAARDSRLTV